MEAKNHVVIEQGTIDRIPLPESLLEERKTKPRPNPAPVQKRLIRLPRDRDRDR
jgi:hypothetical protein